MIRRILGGRKTGMIRRTNDVYSIYKNQVIDMIIKNEEIAVVGA